MRVVNLAGVKAGEMLCRRLSEWTQRSGSHETPRYKYGVTTENADNWSPERPGDHHLILIFLMLNRALVLLALVLSLASCLPPGLRGYPEKVRLRIKM